MTFPASQSFTVVDGQSGGVNKTSAAAVISDQYKCDGDKITTVNFSGLSNPTWTIDNATIWTGPASGAGTIPNSYVVKNIGNTIARGIISVYQNGTFYTSFSIYVYPKPLVNTIGDIVTCNNQTQPKIEFTSPQEGTLFSWTISNPGIGLGLSPSGVGSIPAFTAVNNTNAPVSATVTVSSLNQANCPGSSTSFNITVNPSEDMDQPLDVVSCNDQFASVDFTTPVITGTTTYSWTNDNTNIGLGSSGSGNIFFITKNADTKPLIANITVTPYNDEGCPGVSKLFKITANPTSQVNQPANQTICNNEPVSVKFSTVNTGGTTTYYWENTNSTIGLPISGSGDFSFNAINNGTTPVTATIVVTPTYYNDGKSCTGAAKTFTITVNPSGQVNQPKDVTVCNGQFTTVNFDTDKKNGTTTYNWSNNNTAIGLSASGSGSVEFTAQNQSTSPMKATITVTPVYENGGVSCTGQSKTFTITVNPVAQVNKPEDIRVCSEQVTSVNFTTLNTGGSTTYTWTNNNPSIGLPSTGNGDISFISTNTSTAPVTALITVTPTITNGGISCTGASKTFTVIVNPGAQVNQPADMVVCNNQITGVDFETENSNGTTSYTWSNNNISIGLASSGTGNINSFVARNSTTAPITAQITVVPTYNSGGQICTGLEKSFKITVNPAAQVKQPENEVVCNEQPLYIDFGTDNMGGTTTYSWKNDNPAIGLAVSGTGNLSFITKNTGTMPQTGTITVTPIFTNGGASCTGESKTFTITVNPQSAQVNQPSDLVVCNNQFTSVNFSTLNTGGITTYTWTNDKPGIGLAASGDGNITFTAQNTGSIPLIATIMVTPSYTNGGITCMGVTKTFKITVNPTAQVNQPADVSVCNNQTASVAFNTVNATGTTTYSWTNDNPAIGLSSSGTGDIYSFTAFNSGTAPITANITVTPTYKNGETSCSGSSKTFKIVVNPTGQMIQPNSIVSCNNQVTAVDFSSMNTGGMTSYTWTNDNPEIGLDASGTGNLSFLAKNTGFTPLTAKITVIPSFNNGGAGCQGLSKTFTITINPSAQVNQPSNMVVCNEQACDVNFETINTGGTTTYTWTNDTPGIGLTGSGSGNIKSFTARNTGTSPLKATITVTPTYINGGSSCSGPSKTFTITVDPSAQVDQPANKILCNEEPTTITFTTSNAGGTTTYSWTNDNLAIGLPATGSGNLSFMTRNSGTTPLTANIVVTPTFSNGGVSCTGNPKAFTITINPVSAQVDQPADIVLCNNESGVVEFRTINSGGETTYSWTNDKPGIGLAASGTGNIAFVAQNNGLDPVFATVLVTPIYKNGDAVCTGVAKSFKITVNPVAQVNQPGDKIVCSGETAQVSFTTSNTGGTTTYSWSNDNPQIGLSASGSGNLLFTAVNGTTKPMIANIRVVPTYSNGGNNCSGPAQTFTITVNPVGQVFKPADLVMCSNERKAISFSTQNSGGTTTYSWTNSNTEIGLAASGNGEIVFTSQNSSAKPITSTITVTPTFNNGITSCAGYPETFTITVNPIAQVNQPVDMVVCNDQLSDINFETINSGGTTTYTWTNDTPGIGLAGSGSGSIKSFTARNTGTSPLKATITVTPTYINGGSSCSGPSKTFSITINPSAQVDQPSNKILCNEEPTTIGFTSSNTGGATTYSWTNDNIAIGLPASGSGNLSFMTRNSGTTPLTAKVVVTPTFNNGGTSCTGESKEFTITINPVSAQVNQPGDLVLCNNQSGIVEFGTINSGGETTYSWTNDKPGIGLAASGTGNISFVAQNSGSAPDVATVMVTPIYKNGDAVCTGVAKSFKITVNPVAQVNQPGDKIVCSGGTAQVSFATINTGGTTTYSWSNDNPQIGLSASGSGNLSFTAVNGTTKPMTANIRVVPTYSNGSNNCSGPAQTFTITVNPVGQVFKPADLVTCSNERKAISFSTQNSGGPTTYSWTNSNTEIGLAAFGSGEIVFTSQNSSAKPITSTITVTPTFNNGITSCAGYPETFTITVNPVAQVNQPVDMVVCNDQLSDINFETINTGGTTTYTWTNDTPGIGLAGSGSGNIKSFTARNTGTSPLKATITVTPTYINGGSSCSGSSKTFTITVNPPAQVDQPSNKILCNEEPTTIAFTSSNTGGTTTYSWTNDNIAIGLPASGSGNLSFMTRNSGTTPLTAKVVVTPTFSNGGVSCTGDPKEFTITINPVSAQVNQPGDLVLCSNQSGVVEFGTINSGGETTYSWTNDKPGIGLAASGMGNISFVAQNNGSAPEIATVMVTPIYKNGDAMCTGVAKSFKITVNPVAQVNQPGDKIVCSGETAQVSFATTNTGGTTTYSWSNDNPQIGLSASGSGNLSFTAVNGTTKPMTANIRVVPTYSNGGNNCSGIAQTFTITVNPVGQVFKPADLVMCSSERKAISFSTQNSGGATTYSWTNSNTEIGLAASGSGEIVFTSQNASAKPITSTITVTPTFNNGVTSCAGYPETFTITVNPVAQVNQPVDMVVCNDQLSDINFETINSGGTTTYSWTNDTPGIGLAGSGSGSIKSFTARNMGTSPLKATITVTPTYINGGSSCSGDSKTFTITVNPSAQVDQPSNKILCNEEPTTITFTSSNTGGTTTYSWINDNLAIGLPASGSGNLSFMTRNSGTTPLTAKVVVTPTFSNGGTSCTGDPKEFTITINPLSAQVNQPGDLVLCNNQSGVVEFGTINSGGETTYSWTNDKPGIGLAASGTGNISFVAQNNGSAPEIATVMVTPIYKNGDAVCTGVAKSFRITVNPVAQVNQPGDKIVCSGEMAQVSFFTTNTGGTTTYSWSNDNPQIGLSASGSGNLSFTAVNGTTKPMTANIRVVPTYSNGGNNCSGTAQTFTIMVNPVGQVFKPADLVMCSSERKAISFSTQNSGGTTTYSWTNSNTEIGLAASGSGEIVFTSQNSSAKPITSTITVTPTFNNGITSCAGYPETFTITVNPVAQVNQPVDMVVCNDQLSDINFETINSGGTTTYSWTNDTPGIGLAGSGSGSIKSFTAHNTGSSPLKATITVTPTFINGGSSCSGDSKTFTLTINPAPQMDQPANRTYCNEEPTTVDFTTMNTGGTTTYSWTNNNTAIGLPASGTGNLSFMTSNTGTAPATATIVVTPTYTNGGINCSGTPRTFTITVNPVTAQVNQPADLVLCDNQAGVVDFTTVNSGGETSYIWTNDKSVIGLAASGSGNISFTARNYGIAPVTATVMVTPVYKNGDATCTGVAKSFRITVNPVAQVNDVTDKVICNGQTTAVEFSSTNAGGATIYSWTNDNPNIGLPTSGNGGLTFTALNTGTKPITAHITVTPSFGTGSNLCPGVAKTFSITVNPTGQINKPSNIVMCTNQTAAVDFSTLNTAGTTSYSWTNSNTEIGLSASGSGNISFTTQNSGTKPVTATITVTPTFTNGSASCPGIAETFTITVNPVAQVNQTAEQVVCDGQPVNVNFSTANTGGVTSYSWTNDNSAIGLTATGSDNLSFIARNNTKAPVKATITVTPVFINGGEICSGSAKTFTITVNPVAQVNQPENHLLCNEEPTVIDFSTTNTGGITTYTWTNDNTAIGLSATGSGKLSFVTKNTGTVPLTATITVIPAFNNGGTSCTGEAKSFTITVNPLKAQVNQPENRVICNEEPVSIGFSTQNTGGTTSYFWTNDNPAIGLDASGTGDISFIGRNTGTSPATAVVMVTPTYTNGGTTCTGVAQSFKITVNPTAQINQPLDVLVCNNQSAGVNFSTQNTGGTTTYSWKNDNPAIGLSANGSGNISFLAKNTGTRPLTANIIVTPTFSNGGVSCTGDEVSFKITVNPTAQVNQPENVVSCNGQETLFDFITVNTGGATTYSWTNTNTNIGLPSSGSGNLSFTARNPGTAPISSYVTVTPTFTNGNSGCPGASKTFKVIINPSAQVNQPDNDVVCNNDVLSVDFSTINNGGTTTYFWTNDNTTIGLAPNGVGNIGQFTVQNSGNIPVKATVTVTPVYSNGGMNCDGSTKTFTITVNPIPSVISSQKVSICSGSKFTVVPMSSSDNLIPEGTLYTWTAPAINPAGTITGGSAQNSAQPLISQTLTNHSTQVATAIYTVTPVFGSCRGNSFPVTVTVLPSPNVEFSKSNQTVCSGESTAPVDLTSRTTGNVKFDWVANIPTGVTGVIESGTNIIPVQNLVNNTSGPLTVTYLAKATFENDMACSGAVSEYSVTVNPSFSVSTNVSGYKGYNVSSFGGKDGWVNVSATGGNGQFTYYWTGPYGFTSTQQNLTGLSAGTYNLSVSDKISGCTKTVPVTLIQPQLLSVTTATTPIVCYGANDATIKVNVTGGIAPYQIQWSNSGTGPYQENLAAGDYKITVTDASGIQKIVTVNIPEAPVFTVDPVVKNVTQPGAGDGSITLNITGGKAPLSILWSDNGTGEVRSNLKAGTYAVTINDGTPCSIVRSFVIREPQELILSAEITHVTECKAANSGMINLTVSGGMTPYRYIWSNGATSEDLINAAAGTYQVTVTDANGYLKTMKFEILRQSAMTINIAQNTTINCDTKTLRKVCTVQVTGGVAPYRLTWSGGTVSGVNNEIMTTGQSGTYTLQVTDASGCTTSSSFNVTVPTQIIDYQVSDCKNRVYQFNALAQNDTNGDMTYFWDFGDGYSSTLKNPKHTFATQNSYKVRLTVTTPDCSGTFEKTIVTEETPVLSLSQEPAYCPGDSVLVRVLGANAYEWENGSTADSIWINKEATYTVKGISKGGCLSYLSFKSTSLGSYNYSIQTDKEELSTDNATLRLKAEEVPSSLYYWDLGDGTTMSGNDLTHTYTIPQEGYFDVRLRVINPNGCVEYVTKRILVTQSSTSIPNTITPDGDGVNDVFMKGSHVQVYNRNGILLYDGTEGWDGTYKGKAVSNDTYFYVLEYMLGSGMKYKSGYITVVR
ncbi:PKD-like domain-containing protein [Parabacteroides sp. FAFU027]|uniref:PKD-like domain-containing protein n=2 Tax=Parabacteroides sp. FAFU027 TaxID=2922715 RepID=UPI001FB022DE|nr:PKD-like domain-containing protein [Parabacteroides sp. FAFU027]